MNNNTNFKTNDDPKVNLVDIYNDKPSFFDFKHITWHSNDKEYITNNTKVIEYYGETPMGRVYLWINEEGQYATE